MLVDLSTHPVPFQSALCTRADTASVEPNTLKRSA